MSKEMEKHLPASQSELYRRVDEVLHYLWDPIGSAGVPEARDEYDSYVPQVFSMIVANRDAKEIEEHLISIESDRMGLSLTKASRENVHKVVEILQSWKTCTDEKTVRNILDVGTTKGRE